MSESSHRHSLSSESPYDDVVHVHTHHHHSSSSSSESSSRKHRDRYAGSGSRYQEKAVEATGMEATMKTLPGKALALALILVLSALSYSLYRSNKGLTKRVSLLSDANTVLDDEKAKIEASANEMAERLAALEKENADLAKRRDELFDQLSKLNQSLLSEKLKEQEQ